MKKILIIILLLSSTIYSATATLDYTYCDDTYIYESNQDHNNGTEPTNLLCSELPTTTGSRYVLLYFDLSSIPSNATIDTAALMVTSFFKLNIEYNVNRLLTSFVEGNLAFDNVDLSGEYGATWNHANNDFADSAGTMAHWQDAGTQTDFSASDLDDNSGSYYASATSHISNNVSEIVLTGATFFALVEDLIDGTYTNKGFLISTTSGGGSLNATEHVTEAQRPHMYIEYTVPSGASVSISGSVNISGSVVIE